MRTNRTTSRATVLGLTAGLLGGGAAGLALGVPALTNAAGDAPALVQQDDGTDDITDDTTGDTTEDATESQSDDTTAIDDRDAVRTERLREALQELVDAGTITAEQADAVAGHLATELPGRAGGPFGGGHRGGRARFGGEVVAGALGMTTEELREALRDGSSIAELAEANGVDIQVVIDALVAEAQERVAAAVEDGRLTQAEADEKLADVTERITEMVDRTRPAD